jgi:hypothetical protein
VNATRPIIAAARAVVNHRRLSAGVLPPLEKEFRIADEHGGYMIAKTYEVSRYVEEIDRQPPPV